MRQELVELPDDLGGGDLAHRVGPQRVAELHHEGGRAQPMAGDIAHGQGQVVVVEGEAVVPVPADVDVRASRGVAGPDVERGVVGEVLGEHGLLEGLDRAVLLSTLQLGEEQGLAGAGEVGFGPSLLGDVLAGAPNADHGAIGVADGLTPDDHLTNRGVGQDDALLVGHRRAPLHRRGALVDVGLAVVGVQEVQPVGAGEGAVGLVEPVDAEHLPRPRVLVGRAGPLPAADLGEALGRFELAGHGGQRPGRVRVPQGRVELVGHLAGLLLGPLLLGEVDHQGDPAERDGLDQAGRHQDRHAVAEAVDVLLGGGPGGAGGDHLGDDVVVGGAPFVGGELGPPQLTGLEVDVAIAEHGQERVVGLEDAIVFAMDHPDRADVDEVGQQIADLVAHRVDPEAVDGVRARRRDPLEHHTVLLGERPGRVEGEPESAHDDFVDDQRERRGRDRSLGAELREALLAVLGRFDIDRHSRPHRLDDGEPVGHGHGREPGQHVLGVAIVRGDVDHAIGTHHDDQPLDGAELATAVLDDEAQHLVGVTGLRYRPFEPVHPSEDRWLRVYRGHPPGTCDSPAVPPRTRRSP